MNIMGRGLSIQTCTGLRPAPRTSVGSVGRAVAGALLVHAAAVQAQSVSSIGTDEGLRRQEERTRQQQRSLQPHADLLEPAVSPTAVPELPGEQPCFVVTEIALLGPDAQRFAWLQRSVDPFLDRCIGAQGVSRIAAYLDAQLIESGYVTSRVSVAAQNLAAGRIEFKLDAGRLARVRMVDADQPGKPLDERWGTWRNAFPTTDGTLLNARDLEQGAEQMKRLPSQAVTTILTPGERPDTSIVTIERHAGSWRERLRGGITLDNSGSPTLGRTQVSANLALDNLLGLNDLFALSFNGNAVRPSADHRSQSLSLTYSIPFGYSTLSTSLSHSRFAQIVQLPMLPHLSSGDADTTELKLQHVAWRTASTKTGLYASLTTRKSRSFLDDTELSQQHRQTTFFEAGLSFKRLFADDAIVEAELGCRRGVSWLDAQDDLAADAQAPGSVPTLRPRIWTLDASATVSFEQSKNDGAAARPWQYSVTLKAQTTGDHTLSIDQTAIGNRATVRGFDGDSVLLAESGWYLRNELATPLQVPGLDGSLYLGLDYGRVWGPSDSPLPGHNLAGAALGLRGRFKALQFDMALAAPIALPEGFRTERINLYASATYAF